MTPPLCYFTVYKNAKEMSLDVSMHLAGVAVIVDHFSRGDVMQVGMDTLVNTAK